MFFDIFFSDKYDDIVSVIDGDDCYTYKDIKEFIAWEIENIKNTKNSIVLLGENNFSFIIQFFAAVFCNKNIYLITERQRLRSVNFDYDLISDNNFSRIKNYKFPKIDANIGNINFYTSGSTGSPKTIKKSLAVHIKEAEITNNVFGLSGQNYTVLATTKMTHMFGITFHLFIPFFNGIKICTDNILYPESVNIENCILISTPAFLFPMTKYTNSFKCSPKMIFSAGSKLPESVFDILGKNSKIIDIYGSTETGNISYKTDYNSAFKLFTGVKVIPKQDTTEIISDYILGKKAVVNDRLEEKQGNLYFKNRTDRLFKIYDKRVSADELEGKLIKNDFVENCYIFQKDSKLVCLCALSDKGKEYVVKHDVFALTKYLKKYLSDYSEIIPQKWKYIDKIPMTQTGKVNKALIGQIFNTNLSLPVILNRKCEQNSVTYEMFFYKNCNFFKGHFPKYPIVPGVVQIFFVKELAKVYFNCELGIGQWRRIKFVNIIKSGQIVNLKLVKDKNSINYEYFKDDIKYSSGVFSCENVFKEYLK